MGHRSLRATPREGTAAAARPLDAVAELVDLVGGEGDRSRRFLGGLVAGALVGAAVIGAVGAAVVRRREVPGTPRPPGASDRGRAG